MIPTTQTLAAVALPVVMSPCLMMARTDEADANDDALEDIRVTRRIGSEDGYRGLHRAAAGHRNQWECTETGAAFRAGAIPADRQDEDERHQQMHEMVEAVAPDAEHLGH